MERQKKREQKEKDILFFREMERNILSSLKRGNRIPGGDPPPIPSLIPEARIMKSIIPSEIPPKASNGPPSLVRTISGLDEAILQQFTVVPPQMTKSDRRSISSRPRDAHGRPPLNPVMTRSNSIPNTDSSVNSLEFSPEQNHPLLHRDESGELRGEAFLDGPMEDDGYDFDFSEKSELHQLQQNQPHVRRNTGGTIYVKSTMMNPDIKATIKVRKQCKFICLVYTVSNKIF
jgi:hypothetical protein